MNDVAAWGFLFKVDTSSDGKISYCSITVGKLQDELLESLVVIELVDGCHVVVQQRMKHLLRDATTIN
jgi:hypothetical protein